MSDNPLDFLDDDPGQRKPGQSPPLPASFAPPKRNTAERPVWLSPLLVLVIAAVIGLAVSCTKLESGGVPAPSPEPQAGKATEFDPANAVTVAEVVAQAQKIRTKYGDNLTELQQAALDSEIGSWCAGKVVAVPVVVNDVRSSGEGAVELDIRVPEAYGRNPTVSGQTDSIPFEGLFAVSMSREQAMLVKKGQAFTAYLALPNPGPEVYRQIAGNIDPRKPFAGHIRYKKDEPRALIPLRFLDVR